MGRRVRENRPMSMKMDSPRRRGANWPLRLARDQRGATFVEFTLIALPFLLLLFGTFEIAFIYWANQELEHATTQGARLVRTGQVQAGPMTQAQLKTEICSKTAVLVGCTERLRLDVRSAKAFPDITPPDPMDGTGKMKADAGFSFAPGVGNDVVLVSAFYDWKPLLKSSDYILRASSVIRNEPF
jgi:Flp pilus assembly protein TadG